MVDSKLKLRNVTAWVEIRKKKLPMYDVQVSEDGERITCWIPSESGNEFTVRYVADGPSHTTGRLFVDGLWCTHIHCVPSKSANDPAISTSNGCIDYATVGGEQRKLVFSQVQFTDDDAYLNEPISQEFGEIRLVVNEVTYHGRKALASHPASSRDPLKGVIHERSKKAIGHCVKLGAVIGATPNYSSDIQVVRTLGTFVFRYRPIDLLRANGIAPPDANRKPASTINRQEAIEIEETNSTNSTSAVDAKREKDREKRIARLRAELKELEDGRPRKRIKVKHEVKEERVPVRIRGEVIDLT
ncbi:hypothetical protein AX16_002915 [Volvariella volvacea WC 439]|nr:hypothetical protein AX16_002915 [Volvariella volvacea WC 439]